MGKDFYVVDFEFTQSGRKTGRPAGFFSEIIELGAVKIDCASREIVSEDHCFVIPHFFPKQLEEVAEFCMITEKEMQDAVSFAEMIERIKELYIPHKTIFVAWGDEDYRVLNKECEQNEIKNPVLFEDYLDFAEWYKWEMEDSYTTGLRKATEEQCLDTDMLWHTAIDDARNTGKLLVKLLEDGWNPDDFMLD